MIKLLCLVVTLTAATVLAPQTTSNRPGSPTEDPDAVRALADYRKAERNRLKGLQGCTVALMATNDKQLAEKLQTAVELQLRRSGIRVLGPEDRNLAAGRPMLVCGIDVTSFQGTIRTTVSVGLIEDVITVRTGELLSTKTWERWTGWNTLVPRKDDELRSDLIDMVDHFCNDYLAANEQASSRPTLKP